MNWMIIICETVIMTIAFTAMVLIPYTYLSGHCPISLQKMGITLT